MLRQKLLQSGDSFDARRIVTRCPDGGFNDDASTIRAIFHSHRARNLVNSFAGGGVVTHAFESILELSRVYKKSSHYHECDRSYSSSTGRSRGLSIFTGSSLACISAMSVVAMPLATSDTLNGQYYVAPKEDDKVAEPASKLKVTANDVTVATKKQARVVTWDQIIAALETSEFLQLFRLGEVRIAGAFQCRACHEVRSASSRDNQVMGEP